MAKVDCRTVGWPRALGALVAVWIALSAHPASAGSLQGDFRDLLTRTPPGTFVTGLVMMQEQLDRQALEEEIARQGLDTRASRHQYVITEAQKLAARTQTDVLRTLEDLRNQGRVRSYESFWITNMIAVDALPEVFRSFVPRPDLGTIFVNAPAQLRAGWDDPRGDGDPPVLDLLDNLICVNVSHAWDMGLHGEGRLQALFDTGADGNHPAFASKWRGTQAGVPWWEAWKDPYNNTTFPYDSGTHGTHVLGIMLAKKPDGTAIGVAPGSKWIAAGVLIGGMAQKIIECYQWGADPDGDPSTIDDVPDVINNSWGTAADCDQTYWNAIDIVEAAGIVNTVAVDNSGPNPYSVNSPESRAATPTVNWGVGEVNSHQAGYPIATTSGRGPSPCDSVSIKPEVVAPGTQIYSTLPNNNYGYKTGTSMACPHTSGAVAILRQVNPDLTVDEIKTILMSTALDRGPVGEDNAYGWGIINIGAAVDYTISTLPVLPPRNLTATSDANNVTLTWQVPAKIYFNHPVLRYRIYRAPVGQGFPTNPIAEVTNPGSIITYHDNGLAWGDYQYVVTALYRNGESDYSNVAQAHLALSTPTGLTAAALADTVRLTWQRPEPIFPAFPLQSYNIWRATGADTFPSQPVVTYSDTSRVVTFLDTGLDLGSYRYEISAVYQSGESARSNEAQAVITLDPPRGLTSAVIADTVQLTWQRPEHVSGSHPLLYYKLFRALAADSFPVDPIAQVTEAGATITYHDRALPWGDYRYRVTALYENGESGPTNVAQAHVTLYPPTDLTAAALADTVRLTWHRPDPIFPEIPVVTYEIRRGLVSDSLPPDSIAAVADTARVVTFLDTGLNLGSYRYIVFAEYATGDRLGSNEAQVQVVLDPPRNLTAVVLADTVQLTWQRPEHVGGAHPLVLYNLFRSLQADSFPVNPTAQVTDNNATITYHDRGLPWGDYRYRVTALYQNGESAPTNVANAHLALYPPTDLIAEASTDTVRLTWHRPDPIFPGIPVLSYEVRRGIVGDPLPPDSIAAVSDTSRAVTHLDVGLNPGDYRYDVVAKYQTGDRLGSNEAQARIALDPPRNLMAAVVADTVQLTWQRPEHVSAIHPLLSYRLFRALLGDSFPVDPVAQVTDSAAAVSFQDRGLPWGDYRYRVTAHYQNGESGPTNVVQAHLALYPPTDLTAEAFADTVRLTWHRPDPLFPGIPIQSYKIRRATGNDPFPPDSVAAISDTSAVVTFLDTGLGLGVYRYAVDAAYVTGDHLRSNEAQVQITVDPPRNLTAGVVADTIRLAWERPAHVIGSIPLHAYRVFRAAAGDPFPVDPIATVPDSLLAYSDTTGVLPGHYHYVVTALYSSAESVPSNEAKVDFEVPPPHDLTATIISDQVLLGWLRPDGISPANPLVAFRVFRSAVGDSFPDTPLAEVPDTSATPSWSDFHVPVGSYRYQVVAAYTVSVSDPSNRAYARIYENADVEDQTPALTAPLLAAPNPFNPTTVVHYRPMAEGILRIAVWDLRGALVRDLVLSTSPLQTAQSVVWDGRDDEGRQVASGVYFVRMSQAGRNIVRRVTLLK